MSVWEIISVKMGIFGRNYFFGMNWLWVDVYKNVGVIAFVLSFVINLRIVYDHWWKARYPGHIRLPLRTDFPDGGVMFKVEKIPIFEQKSYRWSFELFFFLFLFFISGLTLITTDSLLSLFIALEILTLSSCFLLIVFDHRPNAAFANALWYFLFSSFFGLLFLFGLCLFFLLFGHVWVSGDFIKNLYSCTELFSIDCLFLVPIIFFKAGMAPFHSWIVPFYVRTNILTVTIFSTTYKIIYSVLLIRFFELFAINADSRNVFSALLSIVAFLSIFCGAVLLLSQSTVKGFITASGIYNMGFISLAYAAGTPQGLATGLSLTLWYAVTVTAFFWAYFMIRRWYNHHCVRHLDDVSSAVTSCYYLVNLRGLTHSAPSLGFGLALICLDFLALPPLPGFILKFNVFQIYLSDFFEVNSFLWFFIVLFFTCFVTLASFSYMRLFKILVFDSKKLIFLVKGAPRAHEIFSQILLLFIIGAFFLKPLIRFLIIPYTFISSFFF